MKKLIIAATAAGTALVAVPAPAQAAGWQPTSGSTTVEAVNPCTGAPIDLTFQWSEALKRPGVVLSTRNRDVPWR